MDYSQLSDTDIDSLVAKAVYGENNTKRISLGVIVNDRYEYFSPCSNPADAWPIIQENRISIMFDGTNPEYEGEYHEWCDAISSCQKYGIQHQSNPLRAAMIVFLMMRDSDANP